MKRNKHFSWTFVVIVFLLLIGGGIVAAAYLGPDRTYQTTEYEACEYGVWAHANTDGECGDATACIDCGWECDPGPGCGKSDYYYSLGTRLVEHTVTHIDPAAYVGTTTYCNSYGDASWCLEPSAVTINGYEPMPDDHITMIEGTHNGGAFACEADTCTLNMVEGSNALSFWALSTYGDSSLMGNMMVLQDTIAPEINASVTGTMGDNGWFVSNAVLTVAFTDTLPGSGISSSSALFNGILTDVSSPVTITEGVYNIQLDTRDAAGWTASASQTISVDTTAPAVTANQPPIEVANSNVTGGGYVNGSVVFSGSYSDATSGISQVQVSPDGSHWYAAALDGAGTWTYDWDSSQASDGSYTPLAYAVDNAGNRTDITLQPITLDNSAPAMSMTGGWYIWDSGHIEVVDYRAGIEHIELSVRDDQGRWPAREWYFDTDKLVMDLQWDREFGDGTVAPTGSFEVLLQAWDELGNGRWITSRIYIPEAGATAVIPITDVITAGYVDETPTPSDDQTNTGNGGIVPGDPASTDPAPSATPQATNTPHAIIFSSEPLIPSSGESEGASLPVDPNLLTGAEALAAAAAATAYALQRKEEKEAERKRQEEQSRAEAMAIVRAAEATKTANYLAKLANDERVKNAWAARLTGEAQAYNDARRYGAEAARYQGLANEYLEEKMAKEYSNQVNLFHSGETTSNTSYTNYKAYHDKMDSVEAQTQGNNVFTPNSLENNIQTLPMTGMASTLSTVNYKPMSGAYTQEELLAMVDENIATMENMEAKPTIDDWIRQTEVYQSLAGLYTTTRDNVKTAIQETGLYKWVEKQVKKAVDSYMGIWDTVGNAWKITTNSNSTFGQRLGASAYMTGAVLGHAMLAAGLIILGVKLVPGSPVLSILDTAETVTSIMMAPEQITSGEMTVEGFAIQMAFEFMDFGLPGNTYADEMLDVIDDINVSKGLDNIEDAVDVLDGGENIVKGVDEVSEILSDGSHLVTDANGKVVGLKPNVTYTAGEFDYIYKTDDMGRLTTFDTDNLQLTERTDRLTHNPNTPGKGDTGQIDHAGHIAGDRFGGSPELDNLVTQLRGVNLSQYKTIENDWAKAIQNGQKVTVSVEIKYDADGLRPTEFFIEYTIDGGKPIIENFAN